MPSRSEMDLPAMVIVLVIGAVLILASVPFLDDAGPDTGTAYTIRWTESETGSAQANAGAAGSTTTVRVPVTDVRPSNATVTLESCDDGAQPPATQAATISWTLYEGDEEKDSGTFQCSDEGDAVTVPQEDRPDVGQATAASTDDAVRSVYAGMAAENETVEYRLEFTWSRGSGALPAPLPVPAAFSATMSLALEHWTATAIDPDAEVPR